MIIRTRKDGSGKIAYRDDETDWMGEYFDPEFQVAVSIAYPVKFLRYGLHPQSRKAIHRRLCEAVGADQRSYPRRVMYGGPGSTEVVAIFDKVNIISKEA